jgi:hypothetical protein
MPLVSITRLRLRSWSYLPGFMTAAFQSISQARRAKGNLAVDTLREAGNVFWTRSLWTDEAAMRSFMESGAHRAAMPKLLEWCDEASVVHWMQDFAEPPTWEEAHRRMQHDGRPSRVKHPSEAHRRFEISAPQAKN